MYDRAETAAANDRLWSLVRERLGHGPRTLTRDGTPHWEDPGLLLSQTCSLPYRTILRDKVTLVASPVHDLPCEKGFYFSVLIARAGDPRRTLAAFSGARLAINSPDSQSGWAAIEALARPAGIRFGSIAVTGAHRESARAVAEGRADLAAIDAVSWSMIARWDAFAEMLSVFARSDPTPSLPYITAPGTDPAPLRSALAQAIAALGPDDREALCLTDVVATDAGRYLALPLPDVSCLSP
jgi:ABC-type phosphate/phosphonate transport system substrate-binding protein